MVTAVVTLVLFGISLPATAYWSGDWATPGWLCLLLFIPVGLTGWLAPWANILLAAWFTVFVRDRKRSVWAQYSALPFVAALIALSFLGVEKMPKQVGGGFPSDVLTVGPGYFLWVGSMLAAGIGSVVAAVMAGSSPRRWEADDGKFVPLADRDVTP